MSLIYQDALLEKPGKRFLKIKICFKNYLYFAFDNFQLL